MCREIKVCQCDEHLFNDSVETEIEIEDVIDEMAILEPEPKKPKSKHPWRKEWSDKR